MSQCFGDLSADRLRDAQDLVALHSSWEQIR